jgi:general secretion pathway protein A
MYEAHYGLKDLPFQLSPDHRFFYPSRGHKQAMAYLTYGLNLRDGFIVITGNVGAGKTTIVGHLLSQIDEDKFVSSNIVSSQLTADDTLRMVAGTFGVAFENRDKASILRGIEAFLVAQREQGKHVFLVVDEVQNMPFEAIEELRMLSNYQRENRPLMQCILLGQPEFRDRLGLSEMDQIRQRVIATYHLGPLIATETREYIEHRLRTVGWNGDQIFTDGTFALIHQATGGVPRQINVLCGRLLLYAALEENHIIDESIVDAVSREINAESGAPRKAARNTGSAETVHPEPPEMPTGGVASLKLIDEQGAAEILSLRPTTLRRWRSAGTGPAFVKIGSAVRYEPSALQAFIRQGRRESTSDPRNEGVN